MKLTYTTMAAAAIFQGALADGFAEVEVLACVNIVKQPASPLTVEFLAGTSPLDGPKSSCMARLGNNAKLVVNTTGVQCTSLGQVAANSAGSCADSPSLWTFGINGGGYMVGNGQATWSQEPQIDRDEVNLSWSNVPVSFCRDDVACGSDSVQWKIGAYEPIFVVFEEPVQVSQMRKRSWALF